VLTGLRQAEEGMSRKKARAETEVRKKAEEDRKAEELRQKLTQADAALAANLYERSLALYSEALKVSPGNVDALAGQSKAQQLKEESAAKTLRLKEEKERRTAFRTLLSSGKANLAAKQYDAAVLALTEATKLDPADAEAKAALAEAQKAKAQAAGDAKAAAEAKRKADEHQKWMGEGRVALSAKQYDAAIRAFREAGRVLPGDQSAAAFLKEAEAGKAAATTAVAAEAKRKEEEQKRSAEVQKLLAEGRAALGTRDLDGADRAFTAAAKLAPDSPEVTKARRPADARTVARAEAEGRRKKLDEYQGWSQRRRWRRSGTTRP
jgi:colicin import membrane protein